MEGNMPGYSERKAKTILKMINERGWNVYRANGERMIGLILEEGPVDNLDLGSYLIYAAVEDPRDSVKVSEETRRIKRRRRLYGGTIYPGAIKVKGQRLCFTGMHLRKRGVELHTKPPLVMDYEELIKALESLVDISE